jgi:short-subunit dehydrogenase
MAGKTISLHLPYIKTLHKQPYPAISPLRQELSQAGRTVLVVGGSTGIGFAIAKAFVQASASHVIITGRRPTALADAVSRLEAEASASTAISCIVSDMSDPQATEKLWNDLKLAGTAIDVLVLNAMALGEAKPLLQAGVASTWSAFETNVRGLLDYAEWFHKQGGSHPKVCISATSHDGSC